MPTSSTSPTSPSSDFDGRYAIPSFDDVLNGERLILIEFFGRLRELVVHAWIAENVEAAIASGMNPDEARRSVSRECAPVIVAHYADFDIRVIWQRAKILGITPPVRRPLNYSRYRTDGALRHHDRVGGAERPDLAR